MRFDFRPGAGDDRHSTSALAERPSLHARQSVTASRWLLAVVAVGSIGMAACSSLSSNPKVAGTGGRPGGAGGSLGLGGLMSSAGGSGTGGAPVDASDDSSALPCIPDGGAASGDCCPDDPLKTDPGVCGCGFPDYDTDNDGTPDCVDQCPNDSTKKAPGVCGCNVPDVDTDGDGTLDCLDACPKDRMHSTPGVCGCAADNTPLCLVHRYQFDDVTSTDGGVTDAGADGGVASGTRIRDSVGTADGTAVRVTLNGSGSVTLTAGTTDPTRDQYIQLPAGIISSLGDSATFETWVNWSGAGGFWQRLFDFGGNEMAPGLKGTGNSFIFATPLGGPAPGALFVSFITAGLPVNEVAASGAMPSGTMQHVAIVVDNAPAGDAGTPSVIVYLNGVRIMSGPLSNKLTQINDVNNWLGRSQFATDISFLGTYYEFRIYSSARTPAQIAASFAAGPDALPAN